MERVHVLGDDAGEEAEISQRSNGMVGGIWFAAVEICPA
jgi:hypothetical protein